MLTLLTFSAIESEKRTFKAFLVLITMDTLFILFCFYMAVWRYR